MAVAYLSLYANAAIQSDGLWTGHDWYDSNYQIGVQNGVPYSNNPKVSRRIEAAKTFDGAIDDIYNTLTNV